MGLAVTKYSSLSFTNAGSATVPDSAATGGRRKQRLSRMALFTHLPFKKLPGLIKYKYRTFLPYTNSC